MRGRMRSMSENERRIAGSAAVTAAAQLLSLALAGVLAILIVLEFGKNARTDGLFAAYGVYGFLLLVAQSMRTTIVARLVEGDSVGANLDRYFGAVTLIFAVSAVPFVLLGSSMATLLTGGLGSGAHDTAQAALVGFWIAGGGQLAAALGAAGLATKDDFGVPAFAYTLGGLAPIVIVAGTSGTLGRQSVAVGIAVGSALTATVMLLRLRAKGYRPHARALFSPRGLGHAAMVITIGSFGFLIAQLAYVVSLGFAARMGTGAVTLYTYAFFTASALIAATAGPVTIVLAAPLSETWDRRRESLEPHLLAVFRSGLTLVVPVLATAAIVGRDLVGAVLGSSLDVSDQRTLVLTFLALGGTIVSSMAGPVPTLAAFAEARYAQLAAISAASMVLHAALSFVGYRSGHLEALAGAASASSLCSLGLLLVVVYGERAGATALLLLREWAEVFGLGALAFLPGLLLVAAGAPLGWRLLATLAGVVGFALLLRRLLPRHWELVSRVLEPLIAAVHSATVRRAA